MKRTQREVNAWNGLVRSDDMPTGATRLKGRDPSLKLCPLFPREKVDGTRTRLAFAVTVTRCPSPLSRLELLRSRVLGLQHRGGQGSHNVVAGRAGERKLMPPFMRAFPSSPNVPLSGALPKTRSPVLLRAGETRSEKLRISLWPTCCSAAVNGV